MIARRFAVVLGRVLAVFAVLVVGCSSSGSPAGPGPAPDAVPPATPGPPTDGAPAGVLRVRIAGLPNGGAADVTVTGPAGYVHAVKSDVDLLLPPGTYSVSAGAIGGESGAPLSVPSAAQQDAVVTAAQGATVRVEYGELETKLKADVRVVDAAALGSLTGVTRNPAGGGTLVFSSPNASTTSWQVGDVILLPATPALPLGFFGRVAANAGGTTITADPASLQDVYAQGGFHVTRRLSGQDLVRAPGVSFGACGSLSHKFAVGGTASVALDVAGDVCITPTISLSVWADWQGIHTHYDFQTTTTLTLTGTATAGLSVNQDYLVAGPITFVAIEVGPIWLTPMIEFRAFADAGVDAGLFAGMTVTSTTDTGFDLVVGGKVNSWNHATSSFDPIWPVPLGRAHATLRAGPQLDILVDGVSGPAVGVRGVVDFQLDTLHKPLWTLDAGLDVDVGFAANPLFAGGATIAVPVWSERTTLATSDSTPPVGVTTGAAGVAGGHGVAIGPDDTIYLTSDDSVKAVTKNGSLLWSYTGDPYMWNVARDAVDGTIYATSFGGSVFAINPDGTQKWKVAAPVARGLAIGDGYVYTTTYGTSAALVGFSKATGAAWTPLGSGQTGVSLPGGNWGVSVAKDGTIYALADGLVAINPTTGATLWNNNVGGSASHPPAIGDDGTIYQVDRNGAVVATNPDGTNKWTSGVFPQPAYGGVSIGPNGNVYYCALSHVRGVSPTGALVFWVKNPGVSPFCRTAPTIGQDGTIFVTTVEGFFAYAPDGTLKWSKPWAPDETASSPAFLSTKDVVVAAESGLRTYASGTLLGSTWGREAGGNASTGRKP